MKKRHPIRPHLRAWRLHMGKKQQHIADALAMDHTTVHRHETGASGVDDKTFAAIAAFYGISPAELSAHPSEAARARELHRLWTAAQSMGHADLAALATFAERLKR
jgi:transcriptional regulator with XRE-family HTH domain